MNYTLVDFSDDSKSVEPPQYLGNLSAVLPGSTGRYEVAKRSVSDATGSFSLLTNILELQGRRPLYLQGL